MAFSTLHDNLIADTAPYPAYPKWPDWLPKAPLSIIDAMADNSFRADLASLAGSVRLIAGGPPCQGFSVGGARNGLDERNQLVHHQLDMIGQVRPDVALIENVEGITRPFRSRPGAGRERSVADEILAAFRELGYDATYNVVDASRFGVPQVRRRAIIIGVRTDLGIAAASFFEHLELARLAVLAEFNLSPDRPVTAREALADLSNPNVRVSCPDSMKFDSTPYLDATSEYATLLRCGIETGTIPDSHRFSQHGERVTALYELAHETQVPGRLTKAFLLSQDTKKDKKVLIAPDAPVSTITTHPDEFIHYAEPRNITVREMARLQSFPDNFAFRGRYTINGPRRKFDVARCSQVGNAVPPNLATAIGHAIKGMLGDN
jgi:DNA (cytosine-5)-methyltransferase 1